MKKILLYFSFSIMALNLLADPVDPTTAAKVATNFYRQQVIANSQTSRTKAQVTLQDVTAQTPYQHIYVFNAAADNGFILVAGDDRSIPILGYSEEGSFDYDNMPTNARAWIMHYEEELAWIIANDAEPYETTADEWKTLRKGGSLAAKGGSVNPLVKTQWNQSPYYNNLCPYNSSVNKRTVTGCVATAMAQVMKFWNYPTQGRSYHSYNCEYYGTQSANFANTTYDWSNMPTKLSNSSSSTQVNAVATLMYHCGVSIDMNYGYDGSSASTQNVPNALITYFKYDNGAHYVRKSNYSESNWTTLIQTELNAGRPVLYRGQGEGGHAFVCDGYNSSNQFHFNWGWGGYCDGYYSTSNLTPGTGGTGAGNGSYTVNQGAVIGIKPVSSSTATPNLKMYSTLTVEDARFGKNITGTIQVSNKGSNNFTGKLAVAIFNEEDIAICNQKFNVSSLQPNYHSTGNINITGGVPLIPGKYRAYAFYSVDGSNWELVPNGSNASSSTTFNITYSAQMETNSDFSKTTFIQGQEATVNVDVWNSGSSTFYGKVRVNLSNVETGSNVQNIQVLNVTNGLQANYHYTNGLNFTGTITAATGTYLMELAYQREGETQWYYAGSSKHQNPILVTVVASPTLAVSPSSVSFQAAGSSQAVSVTGNVDWTASTSASWLTLSPKSGTESGTITVTAATNNSNSARSATITITGSNGVGSKTVTVSQAAGTALQPDAYEQNNTSATAYDLGTISTNSRTFTINANLHVSTDVDYYKITLPAGYKYTVSALMYDRYNNSSSYSAYGALAFSLNGTNTSGTYDNEMPATTLNGGGPIYFRIKGFNGNDNDLGTYQFIINISRSSNTGIEEFEAEELTLYPNPAIDKLYLTIAKDVAIKEIEFVNAQGQLLRTYPGSQREFQVGDLPSGLYFMRIVTSEGVVTKKWVK